MRSSQTYSPASVVTLKVSIFLPRPLDRPLAMAGLLGGRGPRPGGGRGPAWRGDTGPGDAGACVALPRSAGPSQVVRVQAQEVVPGLARDDDRRPGALVEGLERLEDLEDLRRRVVEGLDDVGQVARRRLGDADE